MSMLWVVGQVLGGDPSGRIAWRKLGIFLDQADAAAWARVTGANLLVDVPQGGPVLPAFGEIAARLSPRACRRYLKGLIDL